MILPPETLLLDFGIYVGNFISPNLYKLVWDYWKPEYSVWNQPFPSAMCFHMCMCICVTINNDTVTHLYTHSNIFYQPAILE